jgi:hypothetical protein
MRLVAKKALLTAATLTTAFGIVLILGVALRGSESSWPLILGGTVIMGLAICVSALVWASDLEDTSRKP